MNRRVGKGGRDDAAWHPCVTRRAHAVKHIRVSTAGLTLRNKVGDSAAFAHPTANHAFKYLSNQAIESLIDCTCRASGAYTPLSLRPT
jgi:hypothetical protein